MAWLGYSVGVCWWWGMGESVFVIIRFGLFVIQWIKYGQNRTLFFLSL